MSVIFQYGMEEAVYVIRLKQSGIYNQIRPSKALPSEHRYSASFVRGLGAVHVVFGVLSSAFAIVALFGGEDEVNGLASALWAGFVYVGCGVLGVLASTRWYIRRQIVMFLVGSLAAFGSGLTCIILTSIGIHSHGKRLKNLVQHK